MKKSTFVSLGVVGVLGSLVLMSQANAVDSVRKSSGGLSPAQVQAFSGRSKLTIPDFKAPVLPSPKPGASATVNKECGEALAAGLAYGLAVTKCNQDLTKEYNALTVAQISAFALKLGITANDVLDPAKVAAAIKAKCLADNAALKSTYDTALAECTAAQDNMKSVCGSISSALASQEAQLKQYQDELDALKKKISAVNAKISANKSEQSANGCK